MRTSKSRHWQVFAAPILSVLVSFVFSTQFAGSAFAKESRSGLPVLAIRNVPKPSGPAGGLKVLDWAGFKAAVTYTFDDGIASQTANYPHLHATGIKMTFFVNMNPADAEKWKQIAKNGNEIGNHTAHHCHADGTGCTGWAGSKEAEYDLCTKDIEQTLGVSNVWTTASPFGDTGWDDAAKSRFFLNRGVWPGQIAPNDNSDPYNLPTYTAKQGDPESVFDAQIDAARAAGKWQILLIHSMGGDGGYAPVKAGDVIGSINHARALGDIWIDTMVNIGAYWAGQKAITNATTTQSGSNTVLKWTLPAHFPPGKYVRVTVTGGVLKQGGKKLRWNKEGYYDVALDPGELTVEEK